MSTPVDPEAAKFFLEAYIHAEQSRNFDEAEERLRQLLGILVHHPELYVATGRALRENRKFEAAIQCFTEALAIDPLDPTVMNSLGMAIQDQGRFKDSERWYRDAISVAPDFAEAHNNLGCVLQDQGRCDEAIPHYEKVLEIAPQFIGAAQNLYAALFDDHNLDPAASALEKILRVKPDWPLAHFHLGVICELKGTMEAARAHFSAIDLHLIDDDALRSRVASLLESWDYVRAVWSPELRFFGNEFKTLKYALDFVEPDGLCLEFGVGFGGTLRYIANTVEREVHGFDSFEGLPEAWESEPVGSYSTGGALPDVPDNVHLHIGWFSETLNQFLVQHNGFVSFMNIDCDIYSSTKSIFDLLGDRIVPGTIIVFDEYFAYPGWQNHERKAFQEAVEQYYWHYDYLAFSLTSRQAVVRIRS